MAIEIAVWLLTKSSCTRMLCSCLKYICIRGYEAFVFVVVGVMWSTRDTFILKQNVIWDKLLCYYVKTTLCLRLISTWSCLQTRRSYNIKIDNSKQLEKVLTDKNSIQEEIKSRLKSGNACSHSVKNILSSCLLSKYKKLRYTEI